MTNSYDARPGSAPGRAMRAHLEAARNAGGWMPWAGAGLAVLLWGGVAAWLYATMGLPALLAQPPLVLVGGAAMLLAPGLALICAGIMARESRRSSEANALILTSARLLLEPADRARTEIATIAEAVKMETQDVASALADARSKVEGLRADIEGSVTSALKAAEIVRADSEVLVSKFSSERQSLGQLSEALRNQAENLAKAIPRHAQMMSEAAKSAQDEVRRADESLDQRLRQLEDTARRLAERIDQLDSMGAESRKRAQNMAGALMRLDEQLVQSTRMVDAAMRAGELAAEASRGTAGALRDATSDALDAALKATETITARSAAASQEAQSALAKLRDVSQQTDAATRAATLSVKTQVDETEKRIVQLSESMFHAATRATQAAESGLERARQRIERASLLLGQMRDEPEFSERSTIDDLVLDKPAPQPAPMRVETPAQAASGRPAAAPPVSQLRPVAQQPVQTPVQPAPQPVQSAPAQPAPAQLATPRPVAQQPIIRPEPIAAKAEPDLSSLMRSPPAPAGDPQGALSWRDLLTGIEEATPDRSVSTVLEQLDKAGVRLGAVKASDLRRIASAARQGERQRRRATRDTAPSEIQRVTRLLDADRELKRAARSFVASEEPEALNVLGSAERAREDAPPRLSAYLFLDAALGTLQ